MIFQLRVSVDGTKQPSLISDRATMVRSLTCQSSVDTEKVAQVNIDERKHKCLQILDN